MALVRRRVPVRFVQNDRQVPSLKNRSNQFFSEIVMFLLEIGSKSDQIFIISRLKMDIKKIFNYFFVFAMETIKGITIMIVIILTIIRSFLEHKGRYN